MGRGKTRPIFISTTERSAGYLSDDLTLLPDCAWVMELRKASRVHGAPGLRVALGGKPHLLQAAQERRRERREPLLRVVAHVHVGSPG